MDPTSTPNNATNTSGYKGPLLCQGSTYLSRSTYLSHSGCVVLVNETVQVLIAFAVVCSLVVCLYFVDRRWTRREGNLSKAMQTNMGAHAYALNLVRHFLPTMKVAKYQFRGMRSPPAKVDIKFDKLGLSLPSGDKVLNGVTGEFLAGRMCAIMGPSGAGKTTFMNVVCGKATYGKMSGSILVNGVDIDMRQISSVTGFVPQDDIVHETLTVREQISFSARLRNKAGTSPTRIRRIVDDVLNVMQIDHIQEKIVGGVEARGISGGQRKRVNIGLELAAQPTLLFLDEPTSGLDSTSSLAVVYSLKKMCELGMTCIMVIHQPRYSLFTLFDDVLLLGKGGNTVYLGDSGAAKTYFDDLGFVMDKDENRADWFMDVISGEVPNKRIPKFEPKLLFTLWEQYIKGELVLPAVDVESGERPKLKELGSNGRLTTGKNGRDLSVEEEAACLTRLLGDEWDRIDLNHDGNLDMSELTTLLVNCTQLSPSEEIVQQLLENMSGEFSSSPAPPKLAHRAVGVTKGQFIRYLCSLQSQLVESDERETEEVSAGGLCPAEALLRMLPAMQTRGKGDDSSSEAESSDESSSSEAEGLQRRQVSSRSAKLKVLRRETPGQFAQLWYLGVRALVQWWRRNKSRIIFYLAMGCGAVILAGQDLLTDHQSWDAMAMVNTHTCVGLLTTIFCLNVFGENQPMFWRERNRGMNVWAYFWSKAFSNSPDLLMQCFLFTSVYYVIRQVHVPYLAYVVPYLLVVYVASGWGYVISAWLPAQHGPFVGSLVIFVVCGLLGNPMSLQEFLANTILEVGVDCISITRWSIPMSFQIDQHYTNPVPVGVREEMTMNLYVSAFTTGAWPSKLDQYWTAGIWVLLAMGSVLRLIAYSGLMIKNRDKMV